MKSNNHKMLALIITLSLMIIVAAGAFLKVQSENRQLRDAVAAASVESQSTVVSAAETVSAESTVSSSVEETVVNGITLPTETENGQYAEELKNVAGAAIPNVSAYADAIEHAGVAAAEIAGVTNTTTNGNGKIVCIDAGHQDHGMSEREPNGPGSSNTKAKLTTGTTGNYSGVQEYVVNLQVSLQLRDELERRGYTVVMTRETNNVNISNVERAEIANNAGADIFIRIHCNSVDSSSVNGALMYQPSSSNPYLSSNVIAGSQKLARILLEHQIAVTGQRNAGVLDGDDMTGINWAQMPVTIVEMGFMSNREEDLFLTSSSGQAQIVQGLANGVDAYFAS